MRNPDDSRHYRTPQDIQDIDPDVDIGLPGTFPFTRGIQPTMYRARPWTMRQYAGFGSAGESNRRYRYLLSQGVSGLSVAFDLPTQIGYDSDHALAAGEVGRVGVAIDSIEDMAALFEGIPLDRVSTSMTINATAIVLLALYVAVGRRQGVDPGRLSGTVQNDILKEYIARGTYIYPPRPSMRIVTDIIAYCEREVPAWNSISISGYHIREAGSTAAQEVAFTLANAIAYVQACVDSGLDVNAFAPRLSFFFNAHNDFLEEIAKFRAARRLWARIMRDRFRASNPRAQQLRFHAQTAGSTLTAQQPDNNIVRVAIQAMAAVLGGTQSLHCNGRDEALGLPTELSATIALRTQQILLHETGVANTVDPVGGAYAVEARTSAIEREASALMSDIEATGGTLAAIESGYIQRQIQDAAYTTQQAIESGDAVIVGVNRFTAARASADRGVRLEPDQETTREVVDRSVRLQPDQETTREVVDRSVRLQPDRATEVFRVDPELERQQIERVRAVRAGRSVSAWRAALDAVEQTARGNGNLVPVIVDAVESHATLGEIADTMRRVFGEFQE